MKNLLFLILTVCLLGACADGSQYEKMVNQGLRSGEQHNDIFLGIEFGITKQAFFDHVWDLNKEGLVKQGPGNLSVEYRIDKEKIDLDLHGIINMNFYPDFINDEYLYRMPVKFTYYDWAIWNKETTDENLEEDVIKILEKWHGGAFLAIENKEGIGRVHVKIDGNRQIRVNKENQVVKVLYEDLAKIKDVMAQQQLIEE